MHSAKSLQEYIPPKVTKRTMHKFTPAGQKYSGAKTLVAVICNQLSNIPYIFRHFDLLDLGKILEKKLQVQNNSFTGCHIEGLIMKATLVISCDFFFFFWKGGGGCKKSTFVDNHST